MAEDPNNERMDAMLRDYASKRREAPEPALHPATRRMLQEEVRRVRGGAAAGPSGWRRWWPQIAFGCALLVVMGITAAVLRGGSRPAEMEMAQASSPERGSDFVSAAGSDEAPVSTERAAKEAAVSDQLDERKLELAAPVEDASGNIGLEQLTKTPSDARNLAVAEISPQPPQPEARRLEETSDPLAFYRKNPELMRRYFPHLAAGTASTPETEAAKAAAVTASAPSQLPAVRLESTARLSEISNLGAAARTRFVQSDAPSAAPVLRSFELEQLGEQVRLLDADGSVYLGELRELAPVAGRAAESGASAPVPPAFTVLATGRSVTLGRAVTLQGSYFPRTNLPAPVQVSRPASRSEASTRAVTRGTGTSRAAIIGRAAIEGTNDVPVNAFSLDR